MILTEKNGQWRTFWKNDGFNYKSLLNRFLSREITGQKLTTGSLYGTVHKVGYAGRQFVIKHNTEKDNRLEKRLFSLLTGTRFSRLIRLTAKAIQKGCPVVQDVYLVKEKIIGRNCEEAYIISEYIPGQSFIKESSEPGQPLVFLRPGENMALIAEALRTLHSYDLASNDAIISNFILTEQNKIKIIDLRTNTPTFIAKANDILKMRRSYNTEVPIHGWFIKFLTTVMTWHYQFKHRLRVWRKRVPSPPPPKIWEDMPAISKTEPKSPNLGLSQDLVPDASLSLATEKNASQRLEEESDLKGPPA
jgi:tRNA A-37 threonylcarbamoyl transferase component Bud32